MTKGFDEAEAIEVLGPVRDFCAESVIEFMAACGVRTTTTPPRLVELLTLYGLRAIDIGQELAHRKATLPAAEAAETAIDDRSESGLLPTAHGSERRRRRSAEVTSKIVLRSNR